MRIDELPKERNHSAYWLANEIGMTHGGLYKILHGKFKALNIEVLARICDALECKPSDLLVLEEDRPARRRPKPKSKTHP